MADQAIPDEDLSQAIEPLIEYIKATRRFDFTGYKRSTLARRIGKRMTDLGVASVGDYQDHLEVHPEELTEFFNTILINVTSFFRDPAAWDYLSDEVVPRIISSKRPHEVIRIWSAGCATGQEAYTLAIVLAEALGADEFRERVKIYGTDADEEALTQARQATYSLKELESLDRSFLERYFEPVNGAYCFRKDMRRAVIFGRHDLVQDAPISRLDLLVCRNTLMYFNAETQATVLNRFHFALNDLGFLFLGKAETLLAHSPLFTSVEQRLRIFVKTDGSSRLRGGAAPRASEGMTADEREPDDLLAAALQEAANPTLVVDPAGALAMVNDQARNLFGLTGDDVGRLVQDLELSYRPVELRSMIDEAQSQRRPVERKSIEWTSRDNTPVNLDVIVQPLMDARGDLLGASVVYADVTRFTRLQEELQHSNRELETAYEELQSTNEELETTNEELQSTIEELETTNEELQSTNEELETMNEELQSTNDEVQLVNTELERRSLDLDQANTFMETILAGLRRGLTVLDAEMVVQLWNSRAEELWGLRSDEVVSRNFLNLDIGLPVDALREPLRLCLEDGGEHEVVLAARNRRGQAIRCRVVCTAMAHSGEPGLLLLMEELSPDGESTA